MNWDLGSGVGGDLASHMLVNWFDGPGPKDMLWHVDSCTRAAGGVAPFDHVTKAYWVEVSWRLGAFQ
jgi:hypothetical protein